jgi:hypothetical protein
MEPDPLAFVSLTMARCLIHLQALDDWDTCWKTSKSGGRAALQRQISAISPTPPPLFVPRYSGPVAVNFNIAIRKKMRPCPSEAVVLPHDGLMNGLCLTLFVGTTQGLFWDTRSYLGSPRTPPSQLRATLGHFLF